MGYFLFQNIIEYISDLFHIVRGNFDPFSFFLKVLKVNYTILLYLKYDIQ